MPPSTFFHRIDVPLTTWMARRGPTVLRVALGVVFLWFGFLKFFPGLSPADLLATRTIATLTFDLVGPSVSLPTLAAVETLIGLGLIFRIALRGVILLLILQMLGTLTPLVLFPSEAWKVPGLVPTLEGQYIIKNMVLIAAAIVIGATVRGGAIIASPRVAREAVKQDKQEARQASER
ncbi:MAG: hypothetical protein KF768_10710 [Phycisphaeraceae bacterium]|nr:hypothetical protein [Phycisphaeraceae bacterium]